MVWSEVGPLSQKNGRGGEMSVTVDSEGVSHQSLLLPAHATWKHLF